VRSIAICYDGGIRDNGTPFYLRFAMAQEFGTDPEWYTEDPSAQEGGIPDIHDFIIHVDDGRDDLPVSGIPHPWGYWAVDSHLGPEIRIAKAKQADLVWCAQKPFVEVLAQHGVKAKWLPLACEPLLHETAFEAAVRKAKEANPDAPNGTIVQFDVPSPNYDLAFVGHLGDPGRLEFLDRLFTAFPNSWYAYGVFHQDMAAHYHRARLGINHAVRDDLNMRFFELACMGVPQLADARMVGWAELGFSKNQHFIASVKYPVTAAKYALSGDNSRMAQRALELVRSHHTYRHRLCTMLEDIESFLRGTPACISSAFKSSPEGSLLS